MVCRNCGKTIPDDWKFCMYCGGSAEKSAEPVCPRCGCRMQPGDVFCRQCGARIGDAAAPAPYAPPAQAAKPSRGKGVPEFVWWLGGGILLLVVAAAVLALTLVFANGNASAAARNTPDAAAGLSANPTTEPTPVVSAPLDTSETVQLEWYVIGTGDEPDKDTVLSKVNDYLLKKINATINLNTINWADYDGKVNSMLAAGESADLVMTATWYANYRQNAQAGYFLELDDLLNRYGGGIAYALGDDALRAARLNGKLYALPMNGANFHSYGLMLRTDLVTKYGIKTEGYRSLQDFEPVFAKIKAEEPGIYPLLADSSSSPYDLLDWDKLDVNDYDVPGALYSNAGASNNRVVINDYTAPESVAMYKLMRSFFQSGYVNPEAIETDSFYSDIDTGKYFSFINVMEPGMEVTMKGISGGYDWVQAPLTEPVMAGYDVVNSMLAIPASSRNPERTMAFCELLYSDAFVINTIDYGVEGIHYTKASDSAIRVNSDAGYNPGNGWKFGNELLTYLLEGEPSDKWAETQRMNDRAVRLDTLGFWFDNSRISTEITGCRGVIAKYKDLFYGSGSGDVDSTVAQFDSDLWDAGSTEIIAEMQRQYDAWREGR